MNRWRQRLAELQGGDGVEKLPRAVQNVQNVQNLSSTVAFEHFEQIEQRPEPSSPPAATVDSAVAARDEAKEEGAAIVEHDGTIPREWAEGFARLDPERPPADVPPKHWQRFVDDVGRFLDSPFCAVAISLGWGPYDLFGCDRDRPFARLDQAGLLWFLDGNTLVALSETTASIQIRDDIRHTFRRKANGCGRVLAWELEK